jgi:hypothetical protein
MLSRGLLTMTQERWDNAMACVWNHLRECLAKVPEACLCRQMSADEYKRYLARFDGEVRSDKCP